MTGASRRWIVAALLAACAVAVALLGLRGCGADEETAPTQTDAVHDEAPRNDGAPGTAETTAKRGRPRPRTATEGDAPDEEAPRDGSVVVHVTSAPDGATLVGARVDATDHSGANWSATSDASGEARLSKLARGNVRIAVSAPGRLRVHTVALAGPQADMIEAVLASGDVVEIDVRDARDDRPVAGARVVVDPRTTPNLDYTTTDAAGVAIAYLPPGAGALVSVTAPGHLAASDFIRAGLADAPTATLRIALARAGAICGVVTDPDGNRVAGATVNIERDGVENGDASTSSGDDGSYRIDGLAPGVNYATCAIHGRFANSLRARDLLPAEDGPAIVADLRLRRFGTLLVQVLDPDGEPWSDFHGWFEAESESDGETRRWSPSGSGETELAPGRYTVRAWTDGVLGAATTAEVVAGTQTRVTLRLERGVAIAGVVVDSDGEPIEQVRVGLTGTISAEIRDQPMAYTKADGTFSIGPLPAAAHDVKFDAKFELGEGFESQIVRGVKAPSDTLRVVLVRRGRLTMRVILDDAPNAEGAMISFVAAGAQDAWQTSARLPPGGAIEVGLPSNVAGDVTIGAPGYEPVRRRVVASSGAVVDLGDVHLRPGGALSGILRGVDGKPAWHVNLCVGVGASAKWVTTGDDGRFRADGVPAGRLRIDIAAENDLPATAFDVDVPQRGDLVLQMQPAGALVVSLVDTRGTAVPAVVVEVRDASGERMRVGRTGADDDGRFDASLAPDVYSVAPEGFPAAEVEIRAGDLTFVRLRRP